MKYLIVLLLLTGCFSRSSAMTSDSYSMIQLGSPATDLASTVGEPYAIHNKGNGVKEYEYIERIRNQRTLISENHYFITVQDGKVVSKRMTREKQRDYDLIYDDDPNWDSYNAFPGSFP
jgi:hypothetical protein